MRKFSVFPLGAFKLIFLFRFFHPLVIARKNNLRFHMHCYIHGSTIKFKMIWGCPYMASKLRVQAKNPRKGQVGTQAEIQE